jgi:hypothetical protein
MASHATAYPNSGRSARSKTGESLAVFTPSRPPNTLRRMVGEWMVQVHRISRELADYHVSQMDFPELRRRVKHYLAVRAGMELSAEKPTNKSAADFHPVFGVATTTAGRSALNCVPDGLQSSPMPESEAKNWVRRRRRFLPSQDFAVPESEEKNWESRSARETAGLRGKAFGFEVFT